MIRMVLRMMTRPRDADGVIRALRTLMLPARLERNCLRCALEIDADAANAVVYSEDWSSEAEMTRQIRSERFRQLLSLMEMAAQKPELEFLYVSGVRGLDFVEAVRLNGQFEAGLPQRSTPDSGTVEGDGRASGMKAGQE